jgi:hypothetical protein
MMGSFRFKWGLAKVLFPSLTKTYYANTWPEKMPQVRNRLSAIPPTPAEAEWMRSFNCFIRKARNMSRGGYPDKTKAFELVLMFTNLLSQKGDELLELCQSPKASKTFHSFVVEGKKLSDFIHASISKKRIAQLNRSYKAGAFKIKSETWKLEALPRKVVSKSRPKKSYKKISRTKQKIAERPPPAEVDIGASEPTVLETIEPTVSEITEPLFKLAMFSCARCGQYMLSAAYRPTHCVTCQSRIGIEDQVPLLKRESLIHICSSCRQKLMFPVQGRGAVMPCPFCEKEIIL